MKILVIGGGGREHAIVKALLESPRSPEIFVAPGNGGIAQDATCVDISAVDIPALVKFAVAEQIDYAVVAPDDPLVLGAVDAFAAVGIPAFGPSKAAAQLEGSKAFAKAFMERHQIPTAKSWVFDVEAEALAFLETAPLPIVIKADGLALGKGVTIADTREEALAAARDAMSGGKFGVSGARIVVEEFLTGPEVSVLAFVDGKTFKTMVPSTDHKRIGDSDTGPNTGGMGVVAPTPVYTEDIAEQCAREIFAPTVEGMATEGTPFKGCLYFGLMLTPDGPKVIEYNCRFGDPETQVVLPLLESDLLEIMEATTNGTLAETPVEFSTDAAVCVVMASKGYPLAYKKGLPISIPAELADRVYVAGAKNADGQLVTSGGRVLGVIGRGATVSDAIEESYRAVAQIHFDGAYWRTDIGQKVVAATRAAEKTLTRNEE